MSNDIKRVIMQSSNAKFIGEVFAFAEQEYGPTKRPIFGDLYLNHITSVAQILTSMNLDDTTIAAGILHDVADIQPSPQYKKDTLTKIEKKFGKDIATLAARSSDLQRIYYSFHEGKKETSLAPEKAETLRRMFLAIAKDLRVVLIDLASRIDGLTKIKSLTPELQKIYATETLEIFVPIANRLGLGEIKRKLEDPAFAVLFPEKYTWLQEHLKEKYEERQKYLKHFIPKLKKVLGHDHITFLDIHSRPKSYWSTYQKLERHNMSFEKLHDLVAVRLIVKDVATCYTALGIIHKRFTPISGQIQDYIAKPKENGYKSLHTTVIIEPDKISEIQIKTAEMHNEAEHGICAHWAYKENLNLNRDPQALAWSKEIPDFFKTFKIDFFENQVFTFTPKGDIISLPKGATPVDFAYAVHSDVGNHCESAKIDGKIVPLSQPLKNGDVVDIAINKKRVPSQDWLKIVKTSFAKSHVRKATVEKTTGSLFSIPTYIKKKFYELSEKVKGIREDKARVKKIEPKQLHLAGQKGMLVNMAKCCAPQTNDQVKAYLTKYRAAVLHKISCPNLQKLAKKFPEKTIDATWE